MRLLLKLDSQDSNDFSATWVDTTIDVRDFEMTDAQFTKRILRPMLSAMRDRIAALNEMRAKEMQRKHGRVS
jgi:hypothetical protein